jgi:hypothetical protein
MDGWQEVVTFIGKKCHNDHETHIYLDGRKDYQMAFDDPNLL